MKKLELEGVVFEFDDKAEYEGTTFISFKKITTFKEQKKYQNLTIKQKHWPAFKNFLKEIIGESKHDDEPF